MRDFPQELINTVIDNLAEPDSSQQVPPDVSAYSIVSSKWLDQTRKHHFEFLDLKNQDAMDRWVAGVDAGQSGASSYVRMLYMCTIKSLEGFKAHIRALTGVTKAELWDCSFFRSPSDVRILTGALGTNLAHLELGETRTTPEVLVSLLAGLPKLEALYTLSLAVEHDENTPSLSTEGIQFFDGGKNRLRILLDDPAEPKQFSWVPSTAKFSRLGFGTSGMLHDLGFVNKLVSSSRETLTYFVIDQDIDSMCLNLSRVAFEYSS